MSDMELITQMLANDMLSRDLERERLESQLRTSIESIRIADSKVKSLSDALATAQAKLQAAEESLSTERLAREESDRRCTYLAMLIDQASKKPEQGDGWDIVVTQRDRNDNIQAMKIVPKGEKK